MVSSAGFVVAGNRKQVWMKLGKETNNRRQAAHRRLAPSTPSFDNSEGRGLHGLWLPTAGTCQVMDLLWATVTSP